MTEMMQSSDRNDSLAGAPSSEKESAPLLATPDNNNNTNGRRSPDDSSGGDDDLEYNSGFIHDSVQHSNKHYSVYTAIIFILNYSIGSGVLGLPNEYNGAGYILSTIILGWCAILTYACYKFVGNLIFRAEAVTAVALSFGLNKNEFVDKPDVIISQLRDNINIDDFKDQYDKFYRNEYELNHLIGMFCGRRWRIGYDITFFVAQMISLWSYCALFGASLARTVGIDGISSSCNIELSGYTEDCRLLYTFYSCIFWIWCIILVLMDFTEQMSLQIISFIARIIIIMLIIITSIGLMYGNLYYDIGDGSYHERSNDNTPYYGPGVSPWKWSGLLYFIAVAVFAFSNQFCVPDVIEPLKYRDRRKQTYMFTASAVILFVIYSMVGIVVSLYFGNDTEDPCTLAWKTFRGFLWNNGNKPGWSYVFGYIILLLPAVDLASSYPLNAITLCNTIEQAALNLDRLREDTSYFTKWKVIIRVGVVSINAILGLLIWNFDFIVILSGMATLIALYVLPAYAEYKSQEICTIITSNENAYITPVTDWTSQKWVIWTVGVTALLAAIGIIVELATDY